MALTRQQFTDATSSEDLFLGLHEGNDTASKVLRGIHQEFDEQDKRILFLRLADMNIRGQQLAIAFWLCEQDFDTLIEKIMTRDHEMIECINSYYNDTHRAVHGRASDPALPLPELQRR